MGSGLCAAGVLEHIRLDCGDETEIAGTHAEHCVDDPCADDATRSGTGTSTSEPVVHRLAFELHCPFAAITAP